MLPTLDRPLYTSVCGGLAFGAVIWLTAAYDVSETQGWPTEQARVVSVKEHGGFFSSCGRGGGREKDITWHSLAPPSGLPETFVDKGECLDTSPGEIWTVVRVIDQGGKVETFVNPTRTWSRAAEDAAIAVAIAFGVVLVILCIRMWWIDRRERGYLRW